MIGVYLYDIFGASAGNKSSHQKTACNAQTGYKSKKMNPDSWIIVENCHEPIVSKQTFEKAHKVINKTTCNRTKEQGSYKNL